MGEQEIKTVEDVFIDALSRHHTGQSESTITLALAYHQYATDADTSLREAASVARVNGYAAMNVSHVGKVVEIHAVMGEVLSAQFAGDIVTVMRLNKDDYALVAAAVETGDAEAVRDAVVRAAEITRSKRREEEATKRAERSALEAEREADKERRAGLSALEKAREDAENALSKVAELEGSASKDQAAAVREFRNALAHVVTFVPTLTEEESSIIALDAGKLLDALAARS